MRIGVICPNYPPSDLEGGVSHYTQILARHLAQMGEQILVITNEDYTGPGEEASIQVLKVPGAWNRTAARAIGALLQSRGVDCVNLQYTPSMYTSSFKFSWAGASRRLPTVTSLHTLWGGGKLNYCFALQLLSASKAVVATNTEITYLLQRYVPLFLRKTRRIPIGANILPCSDPARRARLKHQLTLRPGAAVVGYFGMCYPGKGLTTLLETARLIKSSMDFHLLLIGGGISDDEGYRRRSREQTEALGIADNTVWTGRLPANDVSALLSLSDVVLLPYETGVSDRRGSLMAALAHGKAIVTSAPRIPLFPFKRWEHMVWPDAYEAAGFAELVLRLVEDHRLRRQLESGAWRLSQDYQWPTIARRTRDYFHEVCRRAREGS